MYDLNIKFKTAKHAAVFRLRLQIKW